MKLYISDLDGTLLNHQGRLKNRPRDMLNRLIDGGVNFTIATARSWHSTLAVLSGVHLQLPIILHNGVMLFDVKQKKIIHVNAFSKEEQAFAVSVLKALDDSALVYAMIDGQERVSWLVGSETKGMKAYIKERKDEPRLRPCTDKSQLYDGEIYYITLISPKTPLSVLDSYFNTENGFSRVYQENSYNKSEIWYEVFSTRANKGNAALQLKAMLDVKELIGFGDNVNDIDLALASDRFYAVDNAVDLLKEKATGVIGSNLEDGVPCFIERDNTPIWRYDKPSGEVDNERYLLAIEKAIQSEKSTIGTQNEKLIHLSLKHYYAPECDHEGKIGNYFADIVSENGIIEIQTGNFQNLNKKLADFLSCAHVTVVYPVSAQVGAVVIDENTGEITRRIPTRKNNGWGGFFNELYRIKGFLMNPNLSICVTRLKVEETRYLNTQSRRKNRMKRIKTPIAILREDYFHGKADYRRFIPDDLPDIFTRADFIKKAGREGSLILELMTYLGLVRYCGKQGNAFLYEKIDL